MVRTSLGYGPAGAADRPWARASGAITEKPAAAMVWAMPVLNHIRGPSLRNPCNRTTGGPWPMRR